jgi:mono/diheme cytochrome c family protein
MKNSLKYWAGLCMILFSCDRTNNDAGYDYFPDMYYSKAYETYAENPNFADGKTLREPVEGTVPVDFVPYPYKKSDEDRLLAGKKLINPLHAEEEVLLRGEIMYARYCLQCHGEKGDGKGSLYTGGKYIFPPASLVNEKMRKAPDGELYHVISVGHGVMMEHGSIIRPEDRWKIVAYMRKKLQQ